MTFCDFFAFSKLRSGSVRKDRPSRSDQELFLPQSLREIVSQPIAMEPPDPTLSGSDLTNGPIVVVACRVMEDEVRHLAAEVPRIRHLCYLEQGLHNEPNRLRTELQAAIRSIEAEFPEVVAISFAYGLCSRGIEGLRAARVSLIFPRAHDCITLLLGSKSRYADYVARHPGTYWYSPGWNKCHLPPGPERTAHKRKQYEAQFDPETVDYLMQEEGVGMSHYTRATYVDLGVAATEQDLAYTRSCANWLGWTFDRVKGDPGLMRRLLGGPWTPQEFLIVPPGLVPRFTVDDRILEAVPPPVEK